MKPWSTIATTTHDEYQRLLLGLDQCAATQRKKLAQLLHCNADTTFGLGYGFNLIDDPDLFRKVVPLHSYEDLALELQHQLQGQPCLLAEPVLHAEETGGSNGRAKLIPYSASTLRAFQAAIYPWLHDLSQHYRQLGYAYFSISPATRSPGVTHIGIPIGAANDSIYFGNELLEPLAAISFAPRQLAAVKDMQQWQHLTLAYLLRAEDLTLLSVWSPTFITALLAELPQHAEGLLRELRDGIPAPLTGVPPLAPNPERAAVVARALAGGVPDTRLLWPRLQLISCWTHASAARFIPGLQRLFAHATIQGKGLLSTEGVVSIPLVGHNYPVLAVNSGFYEFLDAAERSHLAHELRTGEDYEVVMTVPGLYRYLCGDRVRVHGWIGTAPQVEFIGRSGLVSDLVGEKLSEAFVADCLKGIEGFAMLAPALEPRPHYHLYVEIADSTLLEQVEQALQGNPQYAYARALGQLAPLRVVTVKQPLQRYQTWAMQRGQRLGDIKPPSLRSEPDWERHMCL